MKRFGLCLTLSVVLFVLLGLSFQGAEAGTTGKLTGRVVDASGQPLPGVNVVIDGSRRGAMTDADGYYLILSVDPGKVKLVASMVGYNSVSQTSVRIQADFTSTVDFQLKETAFEAEELVVTAERPPVEPDKTTSHYVMGADQIESLPMARSLNDLVALNPGVNLSNANVIRGSDSGDGILMVDGIVLPNGDGYGRQFTGPSKTAIQEITVISGGANAEYGNLESGAISIVTKDGGRSYRGWNDFRYTPPGKKHWGSNIYESAYHKDKLQYSNGEWNAETIILNNGADGAPGTPDDEIGLAHRPLDYEDVKGSYIEGGLSGPIGDQASFFVSARWTKQPTDVINTSTRTASFDPSLGSASLGSVTSGGFPTLTTPLDIRGNAKLTFRPSANVKMSLGQIYSVAEGYRRGTNTNRDIAANGQNVFLPDGSGNGGFKLTDSVTYAVLTHTLSPKTFYEARVSFYSTDEDTQNTGWPSDAFGFPNTVFGEKDLDGWFNVQPSAVANFTIAQRDRLNFKLDLSSQVTKGHFLKAGVDVTRYSIYYYNYNAPNPSQRIVNFITHSGNLPNVKAPINPIQMGFYVQDKMEFEGMVFNAGIRYDALYSNHRFYNVSQLQTPQNRWLIKHVEMPTVDATWATQFSPRFGVSHPITSRSAFHFTAGLYSQAPDFSSYFREEWRANGPDQHVAWDAFTGLHGQTRMANPYVALTKTRAYEAGADWNFVSDYTAGFSAYYKSAIGKPASGSRYWYEPQRTTWVWGLKPSVIQDMKGFEMNVRKAFSHYFSFNAAINFGWASNARVGSNATMFYPDSSYVMNPEQYHDWKWNGSTYVKDEFTQTERETWAKRAANNWRGRSNAMLNRYEYIVFEFMDVQKAYEAPSNMNGVWQPSYGGGKLYNASGTDRRTQSSMSLYFDSPMEFGPGLQGFHLVGGLRTNMVWRIQSGTPKTYTPPGQQPEVRHKPIRTWTDLQVEKTLVENGHRNAVAYVEVFNLFNQQDSSVPFSYPDYVRWGLNTPRPNDATYLQYGDYNELTRYTGKPREIGVGIKVNF
jgi:hypothetical protein